ncbi:SMC-Scp complex subunit ScpB [uncultured Senegalimassilia sp.]|uniref:SMC-Scp complex subunit ScpB n=1 Tax=uncultured Senegalimassilia sp. TaxID=1714350 RepID=UPI0025F8458A|nr:SMC-Scp complex subunit ScpB [uncultured Senegalimassilia sp.]
MFEGLDQAQLPGAIEAMLFVTDEPVGVIELADMVEADPKLVEQALVDLREKLEREQRGIQLREVAGGWRLYTHPAYHSLVEKYVLSWDTRKLSQAAMETLAIVAYLQPCTRAGVASVRGVNSDSSINSLVEKGLIREAGQADAPGNPTLYATTRGFLEKFGLRSVRDLPNLDEFAPDDATRQLIRERLSAGGQEARVAPEAQVPNGEDADPFDGLQFDFDDEGAGGALTSQQGAGGANAAGEAGGPRQAAPERASADGQQAFAADGESAADDPARDASGSPAAFPAGDGPASSAAQQMLADAMAQSFGLVEKIDFDSLKFETDDE